jgi:hypothetical protein
MHRNYSILGTLFQVIQCSEDLLRNAEAAKFRFRNYQSPLCSDFPGFQLERFPSPVQNLILGQVSEARRLMDDDDATLYERVVIPGWKGKAGAGPSIQPTQDSTTATGNESGSDRILANLPTCECKWFRAWQLPCCHIWHHHLLFGSLLPAHFAQLADIWANNGYEIYEDIMQPFKESLDDVIGIPARVGLDVRERLEGVKAKFHSIADWLDKRGAPLECKKSILSDFCDELSNRLEGIGDTDLEGIYRDAMKGLSDNFF